MCQGEGVILFSRIRQGVVVVWGGVRLLVLCGWCQRLDEAFEIPSEEWYFLSGLFVFVC